MYRKNDIKKLFYKTGEVAKMVGLHVRTIQSYCDSGKIQCVKTESGLRLITKDELIRFLYSLNMLYDKSIVAYYTKNTARIPENVVVYDGDKLHELLIDIVENKVHKLIINSRDDIEPFEDVVELICKEHNVEIEYKEN